MSALIGPDVYERLVEERRRANRLEGENSTLRAELFDLEQRLNVAASRSLAWEMKRGPCWLEINFKLDPSVLHLAHVEREAFNVAVVDALRVLWGTYRAKDGGSDAST